MIRKERLITLSMTFQKQSDGTWTLTGAINPRREDDKHHCNWYSIQHNGSFQQVGNGRELFLPDRWTFHTPNGDTIAGHR